MIIEIPPLYSKRKVDIASELKEEEDYTTYDYYYCNRTRQEYASEEDRFDRELNESIRRGESRTNKKEAKLSEPEPEEEGDALCDFCEVEEGEIEHQGKKICVSCWEEGRRYYNSEMETCVSCNLSFSKDDVLYYRNRPLCGDCYYITQNYMEGE